MTYYILEMGNNYYKNKDSVEEYINMAKDLDGRLLIEKLKNFLKSDSLILEIGSGPGSDWNILKELYRVTGSDYSIEFLKHLRKINPDGDFIELDATTLKTEKKFDGIYSNKVLHHLTNEELSASIKRQVDALNPNGIICHSFWKGEGTETFNGLFVNYHSESSLRIYFDEYFEFLLLENYKEFDEDDSILFIGKKKQ